MFSLPYFTARQQKNQEKPGAARFHCRQTKKQAAIKYVIDETAAQSRNIKIACGYRIRTLYWHIF